MDDCGGVLDYWNATSYAFPDGVVNFHLKLETDLFELAKRKTTARSISVRR